MNDIPETTLKLLQAARTASGTTDKAVMTSVVIRSEAPNAGIFYFPQKTRYLARCIEDSGISDLVRMFCFDCTRHRVEKHFRPGTYDISGPQIKVIR